MPAATETRPTVTTVKRKIEAHTVVNDGTANPEVNVTLVGTYQATNTLKGFRLIMGSGNITATVYVYARAV